MTTEFALYLLRRRLQILGIAIGRPLLPVVDWIARRTQR